MLAPLEENQNDNTGIPWLAAYDISEPDNAERIVIRKHPGLLSYHLGSSGRGHVRLITYWRTREHFLAGRGRLEDVLGQSLRIWSGHIRSYHSRPPALVKRLRWGLVLTTSLAVLAGVDNVRNAASSLFAKPGVWVSSERLRYLQGDPLDATVTIESSSLARQSIAVKRARVMEGQRVAASLHTEPEAIPELGPNASRAVRLIGTLPSVGFYKLRLDVAARAGRLRSPAVITEEPDFEVWSRAPRAVPITLQSVEQATAFAKAGILVGVPAPYGLALRVTARRSPDVTDIITDLPGARTLRPWSVIGTLGREVGWCEYALPPAEKFQRVDFRLVNSGRPSTDWEAVLSHMELNVTALRKEMQDGEVF
jgi:hypothetical protein